MRPKIPEEKIESRSPVLQMEGNTRNLSRDMCVFLFMSLSLCVHVPSCTVVRPSLMLRHRHPTLFQPYQETLPGPACWPPASTFDRPSALDPSHFLTLVPSELTATPLLSLYNLYRRQMLVCPDLRVPGQDGVSQLLPFSLSSLSGAGGCGPV